MMEGAPSWEAVLGQHVALHRTSATRVQAHLRGWLVRRRFDKLLDRAVATSDLQLAKEFARSLLPRDQDGRLLPLGCNINCFKVFGSGVYCYMRWCKLMQTVFLYAFTLSLANLIHNSTGGGLLRPTSSSFLNSLFTGTTLGNASTLNSSYGAVEVLVSAVFAYGMFRGHSLVVEEEQMTNSDAELTQADYTLLVSGLPPSATDSLQLAGFFSSFGDVQHAVVALSTRDLLLRMPDRRRLLRQLHERQAAHFIRKARMRSAEQRRGGMGAIARGGRKRKDGQPDGAERAVEHMEGAAGPAVGGRSQQPSPPARCANPAAGESSVEAKLSPRTSPTPLFHLVPESQLGGGGGRLAAGAGTAASAAGAAASGGTASYVPTRDARLLSLRHAVKSASDALAAHDAETHTLLKQYRRGTGLAFVTFGSPAEADAARVALNAPGYPHRFHGRRLAAQRAPEPSDVKWENLEVPNRERRWRQLVSTSIMLVVASFGTAVICATCYVQGKNVVASLTLGDGWVGGLLSLLVNLALLLPVILGNVTLFVTVPLLAERMERHTTFASKELAIMLKLVFFQVYNSVLASFAFIIDPSIRLFERPWYTVGGALIANILFGDAIFIQVVLDWVRVGGIFSRLCLAPRAKTQLQMDRAYVDEADIYLAFRCQLAGKFLMLTLIFGTAIPPLYLIAAFYFWLAGWIDRTNLLRHLSPPPRTDAALTRALCLYVFPLSLALHALMALFFFSSLPAEAEAVLAHGTGQTAFATATGILPPPDAGSGESPPPPSPPADPWFAFHIQLGAMLAVLLTLLAFYLSELARRHGCPLHLLSARQQQVVISVITQTDKQRAAVAVASAMHVRRSDEYLPPLNEALLQALGMDAARTTAYRSHNHILRSSMAASAATAPTSATSAAGRSSLTIKRQPSGGRGSVLVSLPRVVRCFSASAAAVATAASAVATGAAAAAAGGTPSAVSRCRSGGNTGGGRRRGVRVEENKELLSASSPGEEVQLSELIPPAGDARAAPDQPGERV